MDKCNQGVTVPPERFDVGGKGGEGIIISHAPWEYNLTVAEGRMGTLAKIRT
jgi:hypothetical protein